MTSLINFNGFGIESRPLDWTVVIAVKGQVHGDYCITSFGPSPAEALCCSGGGSSAACAAPYGQTVKLRAADERR